MREKNAAERAKDEKSGVEQSKSEDLHAAQEDQSSEITGNKADESFKEELTDQCEFKAKEFDQRSTTRADELQVLSKTITQLEDGVKPHYDAVPNLSGLLQRIRSLGVTRTLGSHTADLHQPRMPPSFKPRSRTQFWTEEACLFHPTQKR